MMKPLLLLVEDHADIRMMLSRLLEFDGSWDVTEAGDPEKALEDFRSRQPQAVLLDQMLPGMTGLELGKILREEEFFEGPILLYSSAGQLTSRAEADRLDIEMIEKTEISWLLETLRDVAARISLG